MNPQPHIVYYISGHGFGHAARQAPIIRRLAQRGARLTIRTPVITKFFDVPNVVVHQERYDIGIIQPDSLHVDIPATFAWYAAFSARRDSIIAREVAFIRENEGRLVVSDMPPIAFAIAREVGIPSLALTHFTWDWVYAHYIAQYPQYAPLIDAIRADYGLATRALQMPFAHAFDMFPAVEPLPLVVNDIVRDRQAVRSAFRVPDDHRLALLSMGGMVWGDTNLAPLAEKPLWTFLVVPEIWEKVAHLANVRLVPTEYPHYHDLIAAADVVVGKAGWSTVAECIAHRTPLLYTVRDDYRENELLVDALCNFAKSRLVKKHEFERGEWVALLDDLTHGDDCWPAIATDGADQAAAKIWQWAIT